MKLSDLPPSNVRESIAAGSITVRTGPFTFRVNSSIDRFIEEMSILYADYPAERQTDFADFDVSVARPSGVRRWFRPQAIFRHEGKQTFLPMSVDHALPLFEWGLNWCISSTAHNFLILHSAVIEKGGRALIMPGDPGSGKSTLCAALVCRGWRLLSDELTLLRLTDGLVAPVARPISLKNASIDIIKAFSDNAVMSRKAADTTKGTVALMKAPAESVARVDETARPAWIVFPKYEPETSTSLRPRSKAKTCISLGDHSFNYSIHGMPGFDLLASMVDRCACYDFTYSRLDEAIALFDSLAERPEEPGQDSL